MVRLRNRRLKRGKTFGGAIHIRRVMGVSDDTPVIDAKEDLEFSVTKADIVRAQPKQSDNCGYARALCRVTGSPHVLVHRWTTLISGVDRAGNPVIFRYISSPEMRLILNKFDITGQMEEHTITVKAPKGCASLEQRVQHERDYLSRIRSGKHKVTPRREPYTKDSRLLRPRLTQLPA